MSRNRLLSTVVVLFVAGWLSGEMIDTASAQAKPAAKKKPGSRSDKAVRYTFRSHPPPIPIHSAEKRWSDHPSKCHTASVVPPPGRRPPRPHQGSKARARFPGARISRQRESRRASWRGAAAGREARQELLSRGRLA